jgi:hypothetical protein
MVTEAQRDQLGQLMDWAFSERSRILYPHDDIRTATVGDITSIADFKAAVLAGRAVWDCTQLTYALLGAVFHGVRNQDGYTGTQLEDFPHYTDPRAALVGALVVVGPGTGEHGMMVRHPDKIHGDPTVISHGGPPPFNCRYIPLSVEAESHEPPVTMLSIAAL